MTLDRNSREIVGAYVGDRGAESAKKLFNSLKLRTSNKSNIVGANLFALFNGLRE